MLGGVVYFMQDTFLTLLFWSSEHFDPVEILTLLMNIYILNRVLPALISFHQEIIFQDEIHLATFISFIHKMMNIRHFFLFFFLSLLKFSSRLVFFYISLEKVS